MPIKPLHPVALFEDMERARRIARAWKPLDHLSAEDAEIVARAIAEGIAQGRRHGLEMGQCTCVRKSAPALTCAHASS
jgi:hypothetical protein